MDELFKQMLLYNKETVPGDPNKPFVGFVQAPIDLSLKPFIVSNSRAKPVVHPGFRSKSAEDGDTNNGLVRYGVYCKTATGVFGELVKFIYDQGRLYGWGCVQAQPMTLQGVDDVLVRFGENELVVNKLFVHPDTFKLDRAKDEDSVCNHLLFEAGLPTLFTEEIPKGLWLFTAHPEFVGLYHDYGTDAGYMVHNLQGVVLAGKISS